MVEQKKIRWILIGDAKMFFWYCKQGKLIKEYDTNETKRKKAKEGKI